MRWRRKQDDARGAAPGPSATTRAVVAAAGGHPDPPDLIAAARREAAANGTSALFEATLANMTAGPGVTSPEADELDGLIQRAATTAWLPDDTVQAAIQRALGPAGPGRLAEKYARQAAVLRRLDRLDDCVRAAHLAVRASDGETDLGHLAYAAWYCSASATTAGDVEGAYGMGAVASDAFRRGAPLRPACVPDAVDAMVLQGRAAAQLGRYAESEQIGIEALRLFRSSDPSPGGPDGAMPPGWGLPIVDRDRLAQLRTWSDATAI